MSTIRSSRFKKKSIEYGTKFQPQRVYLDFEIGTINALENAVSNSFEIIGITQGHQDFFVFCFSFLIFLFVVVGIISLKVFSETFKKLVYPKCMKKMKK
jgi:hypothetical protein